MVVKVGQGKARIFARNCLKGNRGACLVTPCNHPFARRRPIIVLALGSCDELTLASLSSLQASHAHACGDEVGTLSECHHWAYGPSCGKTGSDGKSCLGGDVATSIGLQDS
jgi:hypothetical protein